jgi:hypothetical protein
MVREPLKTCLITPTFEQLSVMNALALPPVPSLLSNQLAPLAFKRTAVFEHVLGSPAVQAGGGGMAAQLAGHEEMHRPMAAGSPNTQLASQSLTQSAEARLAMVMTASPAIDANSRFMFPFSVVLQSMGSMDISS